MLKYLYDKSKIWFAVVWIIAYCLLMSAGDSISMTVGIEKSVSLPIGIILCVILFMFLKNNKLLDAFGLCRPKTPPRSMLYYLPVLVMLTANTWYGVTFNYGALETLLYILTMFCVGFLEEVIFRGLLFNAMRGDGIKAAVIVSALTFGIGHIFNLFNGSGADLLPSILQVIYASAAGFMFVMIYLKTDSILVCIAAHGLFNAMSAFANEAAASNMMKVVVSAVLTVIMGAYAVYLARNVVWSKS